MFAERIRHLGEICIEELNAIGIMPSDKIQGFKENKRAKKRLGCCKRKKENGQYIYTIEISSIISDEDDNTLKEVIHHELLHTCEGCFNHGQKWKAYAEKVNHCYGYQITVKADQDRLQPPAIEGKTFRYEIHCFNCGQTGYRMKRSNVVNNPNKYRCSKCGGKLIVKNLQ